MLHYLDQFLGIQNFQIFSFPEKNLQLLLQSTGQDIQVVQQRIFGDHQFIWNEEGQGRGLRFDGGFFPENTVPFDLQNEFSGGVRFGMQLKIQGLEFGGLLLQEGGQHFFVFEVEPDEQNEIELLLKGKHLLGELLLTFH